MVVTDPPREVAYPPRLNARRSALHMPSVDRLLPPFITVGVLAGLAIVTFANPIAGRGDYGQWLMTSRYYLGMEVPDYRTITALPPAVPILMAGIRSLVTDPVTALQVTNALLLVSVGAGLYLAGALVMQSGWIGALSAVVGLLVTDRFLELFAFGGLLQAASLAAMCVSVAAFARASLGPGIVLRWWLLGTMAMGLAAMTHVGTGMIAVPTGFAAAGLAALALRRHGWRALLRALLPMAIVALAVAGYWLIALVPASSDYLTNPASLAYRGPDRLFLALSSYAPTAVIVVLGTLSLLLGASLDIGRRRIDGWLFLAAWLAVTWGSLGYSAASGAATDYPRFATLLLAPLTVAAAAGLVRTANRVRSGRLGSAGGLRRTATLPALVIAVTLVSAPLTVARYERQATTYQPRDAASLTAAVSWLDARLPHGQTVVTEVRDGKWLEGLTGRKAVFSQPVRYAFRPIEWQRSADADAILRSSVTLTSGYITAQFTDQRLPTAAGSDEPVPTGLIVRANHGGEFLDLLRMAPSATTIDSLTAADLVPSRSVQWRDERQASVRTVWGLRDEPDFAFTQTVTTFVEGTTLRLVQSAPGHAIQTELAPVAGMWITAVSVEGQQALACFSTRGDAPPCLLVRTPGESSHVSASPDGGLRVTGDPSGELEVFITAATAGDASIGLGLLDPADLVEAHDVGAALLLEADPAFASRARRLEALGFTEARSFGPYRVLVRDEPGG